MEEKLSSKIAEFDKLYSNRVTLMLKILYFYSDRNHQQQTATIIKMMEMKNCLNAKQNYLLSSCDSPRNSHYPNPEELFQEMRCIMSEDEIKMFNRISELKNMLKMFQEMSELMEIMKDVMPNSEAGCSENCDNTSQNFSTSSDFQDLLSGIIPPDKMELFNMLKEMKTM